MLTVRWATADEVRPLRTRVLRPSWPADQLLVFPEDNLTTCKHVAAFDGAAVVGVATFLAKPLSRLHDLNAVQLRGMAVASEKQGQGVGKCILDFGKIELKSAFPEARWLWCNARESAVGFYEGLGFEIVSERFEIPDIGPHFEMAFDLWKSAS